MEEKKETTCVGFNQFVYRFLNLIATGGCGGWQLPFNPQKRLTSQNMPLARTWARIIRWTSPSFDGEHTVR